MKKFTSLFALLLLALSAKADYYVPSVGTNEICVFYESEITNFTNIYSFDASGNKLTGEWPGNAMTVAGTTEEGNKVYKVTFSTEPKTIIFTDGVNGENGKQTVDLPFTNHAYYYIDDKYDNNEKKYYNKFSFTVDAGFDVYFDKTDTGWEKVYAHVWIPNGAEHRGGWPGKKMTDLGNGLYKFHINSTAFNKVIFNKGTGEGGFGNQSNEYDLSPNTVYYNSGQNISITVNGQISQNATSYAASSASYERVCTKQWGTLCLPFAITPSEYSTVTFYQLSSVSATALTFTPITSTIAAGTPVVFKLSSSSGTLKIEEGSVNVTTIPGSTEVDNCDWKVFGTFSSQNNKNGIFLIYNNEICPGTNITIPPYRAWFEGTLPAGNSGGAPLRIEVADTEGLEYVEQEDGIVKAYYDLQGRKLDGARKGLVIENGKIIMVK